MKDESGFFKALYTKIIDKSAVVSIIGLGYIGLPTAIAFAESGFKVLGIDTQKKRINAINHRKSYLSDISIHQLQSLINNDFLSATMSFNRITQADVICICVPTPLTKTKEPDLSYIIGACKEIVKYLRPGQLIVLESTTYPGTTRDVVLPILNSTNYKLGLDYFLAYSPERIDPGNKKNNFKNIPKIISGIDDNSTELTRLLYSQLVDTVIPVSSPEVAEMIKIFENVFRNVNIALVNELAQLCQRMGISVWEVIHGSSTKPFGFMPFYPGPGIGGHCIPLDPYYLSSKARELDFHTRFIELSAEINEHMPYYVVSNVMNALNNRGKSLKDAKVLLLGVAYKRDVGDVRESPSLKIMELLKIQGARVSYHDPYVPKIMISMHQLNSAKLKPAYLASVDCVILATDHSCYNVQEIIKYSQLVYDTRGVTRGIKRDNLIRLGE